MRFSRSCSPIEVGIPWCLTGISRMLAMQKDLQKVGHDVDIGQQLDYNPQTLRHSTAKCVLKSSTRLT